MQGVVLHRRPGRPWGGASPLLLLSLKSGSAVVQWVSEPLLVTLAAHPAVLRALLPVQLPDAASGKAVGEGQSTWALAFHEKDLLGVSISWLRPGADLSGCHSYLRSIWKICFSVAMSFKH